MLSFSKAVLRTLAYADVFDYPLSAPEVWRFLIAQRKIGKGSVLKELLRMGANSKLIQADKGFYFLKGRKKIVGLRKKRERWSRQKLKIARRAAGWFRLVPWVKMVGVTGALAMRNSDREDDVDFLIVAAKGRLWLTRALVVLLTEFLGDRRRPKEKKVQNKICLNMFLDEEHLGLPQKERDLFTAHEVCQLKSLWERDGAYEKFLGENRWTKKYLPNAIKTKKPRNQETKKQKSSSVLQFFSSSVDLLESLAYRFQLAYMQSRRTTEIIQPGRILFHPQDCRGWILEKYEKNLKRLALPFTKDFR